MDTSEAAGTINQKRHKTRRDDAPRGGRGAGNAGRVAVYGMPSSTINRALPAAKTQRYPAEGLRTPTRLLPERSERLGCESVFSRR